MNYKVITGIILLILLIIFSFQNVTPTALNIFGWEFTGSLSLFLLLAIFAGAIMGSILTLAVHKPTKKEKTVKPLKEEK